MVNPSALFVLLCALLLRLLQDPRLRFLSLPCDPPPRTASGEMDVIILLLFTFQTVLFCHHLLKQHADAFFLLLLCSSRPDNGKLQARRTNDRRPSSAITRRPSPDTIHESATQITATRPASAKDVLRGQEKDLDKGVDIEHDAERSRHQEARSIRPSSARPVSIS